MSGDRALVVLVVVVVACSVLAPATFATDASAQQQLDDCTVIDEPGHYELSGDLQQDEPDTCIRIRSDDVVLEGNGHGIYGPGGGSEGTYAGVLVDDGAEDAPYENLTVRNVAVENWATGVQVGEQGFGGSDLTLEDVEVRNGHDGIVHDGATLTLASVTVEDNDGTALDVWGGGVEGTDVTLRENGVGFAGEEAGLTLESSRVLGNDDRGVDVQAHTEATLTDVRIASNGGPGLRTVGTGSQAAVYDSTIRDGGDNGVSGFEGEEIHLEDTEIVWNDGDGLHVRQTDLTVRNVTTVGNGGLEVNVLEDTGSIDAEALHVGDSATTTFAESDLALEPVDREALPSRENGTAAGDGLNVSRTLEGSMDLELDVETDDETVDLWRYDGEWETVEEDLAVSAGSVETTVDRDGTYAPGTDEADDGGENDTDDSDEPVREIEDCRTIYEPGDYEIVQDIHSNEADSCIEIQADDVTIDGNGHLVEGPGPDAGEGFVPGIDVGADGDNQGIVVRNVELAEWERGVLAGGEYRLESAVVRDNGVGLSTRAGSADLSDVVVEHNDVGMSSQMAGNTGTNVTIRENERGVSGVDGGNYEFESSRIVDNEEHGAQVSHSSVLNLSDSMVSGNGGHGVYLPHYGMSTVRAHIEDTTIADNGGDGIYATTENPDRDYVHLEGVTLRNNDGLELNALPAEAAEDDSLHGTPVTATALAVGDSATTAFEDEQIRLEPVDREALPPREGGTPVGDGLNVSGDVDGPVELELGVDTDHDTVDLWRHEDGQWETVEEDLEVTDGSIEATVEDNSVYAPGVDEEEDDEQDDQDGSEDDEQDDQDGSEDDQQDDQDGSGDQDGNEDDQQDDQDGEDEDDTGDGTGDDGAEDDQDGTDEDDTDEGDTGDDEEDTGDTDGSDDTDEGDTGVDDTDGDQDGTDDGDTGAGEDGTQGDSGTADGGDDASDKDGVKDSSGSTDDGSQQDDAGTDGGEDDTQPGADETDADDASDEDGEKDHEDDSDGSSDANGSDGSAGSGDDGASDSDDSKDADDTDDSTAETTPAATDTPTEPTATPGDDETATTEDEGQTADDDSGEETATDQDEDDPDDPVDGDDRDDGLWSLAEGTGFGAVVALVALLVGASLRRRLE